MSAQIRPRRGAAERVTGIIWGAIVVSAGAFTIAALSGYDVDLEFVAIVALAVLGGWLLASAIAAASRQARAERASFAPNHVPAVAPDSPVEPQPEQPAPPSQGSL